MKIIYNKNPLLTTIELNELEKKEFWYKIKLKEMEDLLYSAHFYLEESNIQNIDKTKKYLDPLYFRKWQISFRRKM